MELRLNQDYVDKSTSKLAWNACVTDILTLDKGLHCALLNCLSKGGGSLSFSFPLIFTIRLHSTIHRWGVGTKPFRLPLLVSGTAVYLSTSLLHLRCLSSGHASRLISSRLFTSPHPSPLTCTVLAQ